MGPAGGRCEEGHAFDEQELAKALQSKADAALWSAIRVLEDQASYARVRDQDDRDLPPAPVEYVQAAEHVEALRTLLRARAGR